MAEKFLTIAITPPYFYEGEEVTLATLLASDAVNYVHIRKPEADGDEIRTLIENINPRLRRRLTLHDHFELAPLVGGVHLNSRNPEPPREWHGRTSASLHSIGEALSESRRLDYATLSPVFPSISKPGYLPPFSEEELRNLFLQERQVRIVALGGVDSSRIPLLKEIGFDGAAMLGAAWHREIPAEAFKLQFITNPSSVGEAVSQSEAALVGGCRWIQLRWKDAGAGDIVAASEIIATLCREKDAVFILDDHVELVRQCGADGVHLGKNDIPVDRARRILGPGAIIGATANTPDDIIAAAMAGADYIGYGPFRFTTTKKNLSPVLGLDGYRKAVGVCALNGIRLPIVAIGGITTADIPSIMDTGVNGVAISGTIINAPQPAEATVSIVKTLEKFL